MRKKIIAAVLVFIVAVTVVLLWPFTSYDINRVQANLRELETPYQAVSTSYYLDGGSIGIIITDRDSRKLELALPVSSNRSNSYPRLFVGATNERKPEAVEVPFSEDTRQMLVSIIEEHLQSNDDSQTALIALRGALPRDYARIYSKAVIRYFQSFGN